MSSLSQPCVIHPIKGIRPFRRFFTAFSHGLSNTSFTSEVTFAILAAVMAAAPLPLAFRLTGIFLLLTGIGLHMGRGIKRMMRSPDENYGHDPSLEAFFHVVYAAIWALAAAAAFLYVTFPALILVAMAWLS